MPPELLTPSSDTVLLHAALGQGLTDKAVAESKAASLGNQVSLLLRRITELTTQLARATDRPVQLALGLELKILQDRLAIHATETFGSKPERRPHKDDTPKAPPKRSRHGGKRTAQPNLPVVVEICHLDGADCCSGRKRARHQPRVLFFSSLCLANAAAVRPDASNSRTMGNQRRRVEVERMGGAHDRECSYHLGRQPWVDALAAWIRCTCRATSRRRRWADARASALPRSRDQREGAR